MNFENIIVIGICFVAIAIVAYYFYSKYTSQQNDMNALSKRFETIEMMFTTPPLQKELSDVYNKKHRAYDTNDFTLDPPSSQKAAIATQLDGLKGRHDQGVFGIKTTWENTPSDRTPDRLGRLPAEFAREEVSPFQAGSSQGLLEPLMPSKIKINCEGLCDLQPLQIETNGAEIDEIVENEINNIERNQKKMSPKQKK